MTRSRVRLSRPIFTPASVAVLLVFHLTASYIATAQSGTSEYYGKYLGPLKSYLHKLGGDVYAVDARTLHVRNFMYDGKGPAAYFYGSNGKTPDVNGFKIRDERASTNPLKEYRGEHLTITLPDGMTLHDIKWFYVWCEDFALNFGDVKIPYNLDYPKPQKIDALSGIHGVSSDNIVVVDAQTLLIPGFSYDGEAPDAKFWVGAGDKPTPQGLRVSDENGKEVPLRRYNRKTIVLTLPGDLTMFDIGHFGVWCEAFTVDFGHVIIPSNLNVPPSLKMLGVLPQSKLNCEVLHEPLGYEVRWAIAGDSIVVQLVAKLEANQYMSFGLSGSSLSNRMVGGDVVVAGVDQDTTSGFAQDYYLLDKSQCVVQQDSGQVSGSCPDSNIQGPAGESVRLLNAAIVNGYSIVTYQRPLKSKDNLDLSISINNSQPVIWAIGPLNDKHEVSYHPEYSKETTKINFGRLPQWNCPIPDTDAKSVAVATVDVTSESVPESTKGQTAIKEVTPTKKIRPRPVPNPAPVHNSLVPWEIPPIQCYEPEDGVFYAQMGPTGGKHGYPAITGHVGWGISWYINGLLIPEINVVRGQTYTFVVEGGLDPEIPAKYHPFYITDDPVGGYGYKTPEERANIRIFAGVSVSKTGEIVPTGIGRLCNWTPDPQQPSADEFVSFGAYQRTLSLSCDQGDPGIVQWTPDANTPDTVYYHCFTHRHLGWKINVLDSCDKEQPGSESATYSQEDLQSRGSIQYTTRVKPDNNNLEPLKSSEPSDDHLTLIPSVLENNLKNDFAKTQHIKPLYAVSTQNITLYTYPTSNQTYGNVPFYMPQSHYGSPQPIRTSTHKYVLHNNNVNNNNNNLNYRPVRQPVPVPLPNFAPQQVTPNFYTQPVPAASNYHAQSATNVPTVLDHRRPTLDYQPQSQQNMYVYQQQPQSQVPVMHGYRIPGKRVPKPVGPVRSVVYKKPVHKLPTATVHPYNPVPPAPGPLPAGSIPQKVRHQPPPQQQQPSYSAQPSTSVSKTVSVSYSTSKNPNKQNHQHHAPQYVQRQHPYPQHQQPHHQKSHLLMRNAQEFNGENVAVGSGSEKFRSGFNPNTVVVEGGFKPIFPDNFSPVDRISEDSESESPDEQETTLSDAQEEVTETKREKKKMSKKLISRKPTKEIHHESIEQITTAEPFTAVVEFGGRPKTDFPKAQQADHLDTV
ncbi:protein Skeletor, isoforms B/C-like [Adelges cooleyi]|uniref:protein Skeletor, isoforms B/C-like n=1 Tax=Adelges cooleyi TaxID=133065 RepID=UPI00218086CE|nr:protein Skeletor, isoforms B/C-like [Adelges cooleyi]